MMNTPKDRLQKSGPNVSPACHACKNKSCDEGVDCFNLTDEIMPAYEGEILSQARAASFIEGQYYLKKNRLEEVVLFSQKMNYKKLGVAFCIGLAEEARILGEYLERWFEVASVCCKVCGVDKDVLNLKKIDAGQPEAMCNPVTQAILLNQAGTDLNLLCGLCIGHDILFTNHSKAPVSTFIVKDRVLAHNTVASLTNRYARKRWERSTEL